VASAGAHELRLRYAAGAGDATRRILVNGAQVAAGRPFPSTGGWGTWNTVVLNGVTLARGHNTIRLDMGSNFLNLDRLDVSGQHQAE
jgi:hypothetical protein